MWCNHFQLCGVHHGNDDCRSWKFAFGCLMVLSLSWDFYFVDAADSWSNIEDSGCTLFHMMLLERDRWPIFAQGKLFGDQIYQLGDVYGASNTS
ncbi:hypothetical protein BT93_D0659 [Corymbia citriodora subsp. variegata]|nr:hypothetical protein BT93_D0659 [Corymbia citriodora subsp. variegata]